MSTQRRWTIVPRTLAGSVGLLLAGLVLLAYNIWQLADATELAILPVIAIVLAVVVIGSGIAGLVSARRVRQ